MRILMTAEAKIALIVLSIIEHMCGDGDDDPGHQKLVQLTTLGGRSALRISDELKGHNAWVTQSSTSDQIVVILANRNATTYDVRRGVIPIDETEEHLFDFDQPYLAASCIFNYLNQP